MFDMIYANYEKCLHVFCKAYQGEMGDMYQRYTYHVCPQAWLKITRLRLFSRLFRQFESFVAVFFSLIDKPCTKAVKQDVFSYLLNGRTIE